MIFLSGYIVAFGDEDRARDKLAMELDSAVFSLVHVFLLLPVNYVTDALVLILCLALPIAPVPVWHKKNKNAVVIIGNFMLSQEDV